MCLTTQVSFLQKKNIAKCFFDISNGVIAVLPKNRRHFSNKMILKLELSKNIFYKNIVQNWYSSMKKIKRFEIFWHRKLTLNVQISWFLMPLCHLSITDIRKTFCNIWFFVKMKLVSLSKSGYWENSTLFSFVQMRSSLCLWICEKHFFSFLKKTCHQRKLQQTNCLLFNFWVIPKKP